MRWTAAKTEPHRWLGALRCDVRRYLRFESSSFARASGWERRGVSRAQAAVPLVIADLILSATRASRAPAALPIARAPWVLSASLATCAW